MPSKNQRLQNPNLIYKKITDLKLLFSGVGEGHSSPGTSAKCALEKYNSCEVRFSEQKEFQDTSEWIRKLKWCDVVVAVYQDAPGTYLTRQLSFAVILGKPVVRWWIGTDVLLALDSANFTKRFSKILHDQIAVAPHLVKELETIGIGAEFIPSLIDDFDPKVPTQDNFGESILVYLPADRLDFYGRRTVEPLIQKFPELHFIIVADDSHSLSKYPNVESLGWVDLNTVWSRIRCLLRVTNHDGLPRMVVDALRRGIHVIYSWPLEGCVLANSLEQCSQALDELKKLPKRKLHSSETFLSKLYQVDPAIRFLEVLQSASKNGPSIRNKTSALLNICTSFLIRR